MSTGLSMPGVCHVSAPQIPREVPTHIAEQVEIRDGDPVIEVSALFEDAVQEVRHLCDPSDTRSDNRFTIGPDARATFPAPGEGLPAPLFPLIEPSAGAYEVRFTLSMDGDADIDGERLSLEELVASGRARPLPHLAGAFGMVLPDGATLCLRLGENSYIVRSVPRPRTYPVPLGVDWGAHAYTGGVLLTVAIFLAMSFSLPADPRSLSIDAFLADHRLVRVEIVPPEPEAMPAWLKQEAAIKAERQRAIAAARGPQRIVERERAMPGPAAPARPLSREAVRDQARQVALTSGVLSALRSGAAAGLFGREPLFGEKDAEVLSGLVATEMGNAYSPGGGPLVSTCVGGTCADDGGVRVGDIRGVPVGPGAPSGPYAPSGRVARLGPHRSSGPEVAPAGPATVIGGMDKELIRRVIRRHINEVKFCYERELLRNAGLGGRVMVQFTISGTGQVLASAVLSSTLGSTPVEQCIASAVRRWEFPRPQSGIVVVSYPFLLKTASEG